MNILADLEDFIKEFNHSNNIEFNIDTIRIEFSKQHKKEKLLQLGKWKKINTNDKRIIDKLKKRLDADEITSAYQLENFNIYYYNTNKDKPHYRKAIMVIFGMKQYHKEPPPHQIVNKIVSILKNISNVDICFDSSDKPNINKLSEFFKLTRYVTKDGVFTDTYYINDTNILMIEKITIYDKAYKNELKYSLWRIEALINIPNVKYMALPLKDLKFIVNKCI